MFSFCSKTDFTFLLLTITFEPLEINQSYIPHLKVLVCGINASSSQCCSCIFTLCYTHLDLTLLLHKKGLVATGVATTVLMCLKILKQFIASKVMAQRVCSFITMCETSFYLLNIIKVHNFSYDYTTYVVQTNIRKKQGWYFTETPVITTGNNYSLNV